MLIIQYVACSVIASVLSLQICVNQAAAQEHVDNTLLVTRHSKAEYRN